MWKDSLRLQLDLGLTLAEVGWGIALSGALNKLKFDAAASRPVIAIPGFMAPERSMSAMLRFLNRNGFAAHGWAIVWAGSMRENWLSSWSPGWTG